MGLTYKQKFNKKHNQPLNESNSMETIAKLSGVKKSILQKVFQRGIGAYKTNIESVRLKSGKKDYSVRDPKRKMSPERWAYARVYSFVGGGKTQSTADKDLWEKHLKSKK